MNVKKADVAGMFYPDDPDALHFDISEYINGGENSDFTPKAIIAPHAGYVYSGPIAGSAYKSLLKFKDTFKNVVLLSPSHNHYFEGIAVHSADFFETPLGKIKINRELIDKIKSKKSVLELDQIFINEHSLEVQIPFIQTVFKDIALLPIVVGKIKEEELSVILDELWNEETLIIVSTDLTHFLSYEAATEVDRKTSDMIEQMDYSAIPADSACGYHPLKGLLYLSKQRGYNIHTIDLRNSGDTAGDKSRVVGYGAYIVE